MAEEVICDEIKEGKGYSKQCNIQEDSVMKIIILIFATVFKTD